jgi:DNA-binding HxlR family transcriptional regulator
MAATPTSTALDIPSARHYTECSVEDWLGFLGHRWNALFLWHLSISDKRFSDLFAVMPGITPKVMTERLEGLASRGLIGKTELATFPRGTIYQITDRGRALVHILDQIEHWAAVPLFAPPKNSAS